VNALIFVIAGLSVAFAVASILAVALSLMRIKLAQTASEEVARAARKRLEVDLTPEAFQTESNARWGREIGLSAASEAERDRKAVLRKRLDELRERFYEGEAPTQYAAAPPSRDGSTVVTCVAEIPLEVLARDRGILRDVQAGLRRLREAERSLKTELDGAS
jgi:hypothetical protein